MNELLEQAQLEIRMHNVEFQLRTKAQLAKDFGTKGIQFSSSFLENEQSLDLVISEIADKINEVLEMGEPALLQLMYTIDLKESRFLHAISKSDFLEELASLVLRREAFKVFLREKFKS